jgi:hypothetical protein
VAASLDIFDDRIWQMSLGERAAIEGVLTQLKPSLSIELGSAEGASLRRIARHSGEVHAFDLRAPDLPMPENVTLHTGDSHELLPPFLAELEQQERGVDFVLVDGDHSAEGVRRDLEDLLNSRALAQTIILIHDTANEQVRRGVDAVRFRAWPKVALVDLDWVPGRLFAEPALRHELWYGLGLVILAADRPAYRNGSVYQQRYHPMGGLLAEVRDRAVSREIAPEAAQPECQPQRQEARVLELHRELALARRREAELDEQLVVLVERLARAERALSDIKGSSSWRLTEPLRAVKRHTGRSRV